MIDRAIEKAAILIEALPYIHRFRGEAVVVKIGGSIMENREGVRKILQDIAFMECVGLRPMVVHGGGKAISAAMRAAGIKPNFVDGLRVSDEATIRIVDRVLNNEVNRDLVEMLEGLGYRARGMRGQNVLTVERFERDGRDWGLRRPGDRRGHRRDPGLHRRRNGADPHAARARTRRGGPQRQRRRSGAIGGPGAGRAQARLPVGTCPACCATARIPTPSSPRFQLPKSKPSSPKAPSRGA